MKSIAKSWPIAPWGRAARPTVSLSAGLKRKEKLSAGCTGELSNSTGGDKSATVVLRTPGWGTMVLHHPKPGMRRRGLEIRYSFTNFRIRLRHVHVRLTMHC